MRDSGNLENKVLSAKEEKKHSMYYIISFIHIYKILFVFLYVQEKRNTKTNNNNDSSSNNKNKEMTTNENREKSTTKLPQGINVQ